MVPITTLRVVPIQRYRQERIKLKAGNMIYIKTLDLSQDFEEIKKQLDEFALSE